MCSGNVGHHAQGQFSISNHRLLHAQWNETKQVKSTARFMKKLQRMNVRCIQMYICFDFVYSKIIVLKPIDYIEAVKNVRSYIELG